MTAPLPLSDVEVAEARQKLARARLDETVGLIQAQMEPARLADAGMEVVRGNPGRVAGGVAVVAAFLGRKAILRGLGSGVKKIRGK